MSSQIYRIQEICRRKRIAYGVVNTILDDLQSFFINQCEFSKYPDIPEQIMITSTYNHTIDPILQKYKNLDMSKLSKEIHAILSHQLNVTDEELTDEELTGRIIASYTTGIPPKITTQIIISKHHIEHIERN